MKVLVVSVMKKNIHLIVFQDATFVDNKVEFQTAKESEMVSSFQKETDFKDESFKASGKKTKVKRKSQITKKPTKKRAPSLVLPQRSLKNKRTHRRQSSSDSQTLKQSNIVDNSSAKMLTNNNEPIGIISDIEKSPESKKKMLGKIAGNKCESKTVKQAVLDLSESCESVLSAGHGSYHKKDVYDIHESTNNLPNQHFQKRAKKQSLFALQSNRKRSIKEKKLKLKTSGKRNSSEILFNPIKHPDFTNSSQSTSYCSYFASCKNGNNRMSDVERDGIVPICALNQEFTCPKGSVSLIKFKRVDTRSRQEILNSVTKGNKKISSLKLKLSF